MRWIGVTLLAWFYDLRRLRRERRIKKALAFLDKAVPAELQQLARDRDSLRLDLAIVQAELDVAKVSLQLQADVIARESLRVEKETAIMSRLIADSAVAGDTPIR